MKNPKLHARSLRAAIAPLLVAGAIARCGGMSADDSSKSCTPLDGGAPSCSYVVEVKNTATCDTTSAGFCASVCGPSAQGCTVSGATTITCWRNCAIDGRRPPRLRSCPKKGVTPGAHFARMAYYEAASVDAFQMLVKELTHHGAPASLVASARRAARDEEVHARMCAREARRHGARSRRPRVPRGPVRSIEEIALENAREGCVREMLGACVGLWQAKHASLARVRDLYARIARDELRHATLSWRMHGWLLSQLEESAHERVTQHLREALDAALLESPPAVPAGLGFPTEGDFRAFVSSVVALARSGTAPDARVS